MKKAIFAGLGLILVTLAGAGAYLWTPAPPKPAFAAFKERAQDYDVRIIRDQWGVPHIYGKRDPDVGFGLAYAHAEDDWATIQDTILFARGTLALHKGKEGAITDYLVAFLRVWPDIDAQYESALRPATRALAEAYADGINLWAAENPEQILPGVLPLTGKDIVAGFVSRAPFFYGLDEEITAITEGTLQDPAARAASNGASVSAFLFGAEGSRGVGSNAIAVAPSRAADGHTRLMINSHQPFNGPVAWYEARLKSEEGWDIIGSLFPGTPLILHGATPDLGWAFTVNHPDLVDIYELEVDNPKSPKKYKFDGAWRDFEISKSDFRVKLFGPLSLPVKRDILWSVHGPVLATEYGTYAIRHAAQGDLGALEQWYDMNRAENFDDFQNALKRQGIPSFNLVYGDGEGHIGFFYNAKMPDRADLPGTNWRDVLPGDKPEAVWQDFVGFAALPQVVDPASGYVLSANHTPFKTSGTQDNPQRDDYPENFGFETLMTNRALRAQELYGTDNSITGQEFYDYKNDHFYSDNSVMVKELNKLQTMDFSGDPTLLKAQETMRNWSQGAAIGDKGTALAVLTMRELFDTSEGRLEVDLRDTFSKVAGQLMKTHGRVDVPWEEVSRLKRGKTDMALNGGPATLRAIYSGPLEEDGTINAGGGDTYILYADWDEEGTISIETIHQYGSATLDEASPHYDDQVPLFVAEKMKKPAMALDDLLKEATRDYRPGRENAGR